MSDLQSASGPELTKQEAKELARQEAKLQQERYNAEQRALGRVRVAGWVPKELAGDANEILQAINAGQIEYLPATVADREAKLRGLQAAGAAVEQQHQEFRRVSQELLQGRQDAIAAKAELTRSAELLAAEQSQRQQAESHLAEAQAELAAARPVMQRLQQPGLRAALARMLLN